jgi:hypothetical protein
MLEVNSDPGSSGQPVDQVPVLSGAEGRAWRDAVDRILVTWLLSGIDGAGLWEAVMANAPRVTAIRGVGHLTTSGGPPGARAVRTGPS